MIFDDRPGLDTNSNRLAHCAVLMAGVCWIVENCRVRIASITLVMATFVLYKTELRRESSDLDSCQVARESSLEHLYIIARSHPELDFHNVLSVNFFIFLTA